MRYDIVFDTNPPLSADERRLWVRFFRDMADALHREDDVRLPTPNRLIFTGHRGVVVHEQ